VLGLAQLRDPRPVVVGHRRGSVGAQQAMGRGDWSAPYVDRALMGLVERVTRRLRKVGRRGRTVTLRLRFDDFTRATRSSTFAAATDETRAVLEAARRLLADARPLVAVRGLTLIGVAVSNLDDGENRQLELPFARRGSMIDSAMDDVRRRFGSTAVTPAALLGRDPELTVPMLPD
jgi:DNA polymerase-4